MLSHIVISHEPPPGVPPQKPSVHHLPPWSAEPIHPRPFPTKVYNSGGGDVGLPHFNNFPNHIRQPNLHPTEEPVTVHRFDFRSLFE